MKSSKRILSITIKRINDDSPDTSWLGEYSNNRTSEFSIDRKHTLECIANTPWPDAPEHTVYECGICDHCHPWEFDGDCREDSQRFGNYEDYAESKGIKPDAVTIRTWEERQQADNGCDCDESGDMQRGEYRYFNPSFNYVDDKGNALPENTPEEIRKYVAEDYARMERIQSGYIGFMCVAAEAEIELTIDGISATKEVSSGYICGIESDCDESEFKSTEQEQLSELRSQLSAIGFSKRAIATAVKNLVESE